MNQEALDNREAVNEIKLKLVTGQVTYEEAKELCQPIIERMYQKQLEIGKKYGKKPRKISALMLLR